MLTTITRRSRGSAALKRRRRPIPLKAIAVHGGPSRRAVQQLSGARAPPRRVHIISPTAYNLVISDSLRGSNGLSVTTL
jgi:hypothetical protein